MDNNLQQIQEDLKQAGLQYKANEPLSPFTTWKIGGPADILLTVTAPDQAATALQLAHKYQVPVTFLGGGSNVLINDAGVKGLVFKNELRGIEVLSEDGSPSQPVTAGAPDPKARLEQVDTSEYYDFAALDYDESTAPAVTVSVLTGTVLAYAINNLISQGITGLQWFAGIPGTVGGAVLNNIHGGSHFFSEFVVSVTVLDPEGRTVKIPKEQLGFDYDYSDLQDNTRFIVSVELTLRRGDKARAQGTAIRWAQEKKKKQPYNTAGCCFKNLAAAEMQRLQLASNSWGYIIDKKLGLKGHRIGGAKISDLHAAFIENTGTATSADVLALIDLIYARSRELLGITPRPEIFFLGFTPEQTAKYLQ